MPTTISVSRDSGYADRLRDYRVLLDGAEIGRLGNGAAKTFEISSGQHQLMIKVDWGRSNIFAFDIGEGQSARDLSGSVWRAQQSTWAHSVGLGFSVCTMRMPRSLAALRGGERRREAGRTRRTELVRSGLGESGGKEMGGATSDEYFQWIKKQRRDPDEL